MTTLLNRFNSRPSLFCSVLTIGVVASGLLVGCGGGSASGGNNGGGGGGGVNQPIVFVSDRDGNNEIFRMLSDGSSQRQLTNSAGSNFNPSINRAGTEVVFASNRDGNNEIYKLTLANNFLQRFTEDETDVSDTAPVFSPDGSRIAWISEREGAANIWVMNATGSDQTKVTTTGADEVTWSPDGEEVAFFRNSNIVIHNIDTQAERTLNTTGGSVFNLRWSPNGNKFLFTRLGVGVGSPATLVSYDVITGVETVLAPENTSQTYNGSWSRDNNRVVWEATKAVQTDTDGNSQIYVGTASQDPNGPTRLTSQGNNTEPAWAE